MGWPKIIACDFDNTLFTDGYPGVGEPIFMTIEMLKAEKENGAKIILWTNREGRSLVKALDACNNQGIFFDAVNDNLPEVVEYFHGNMRKIFANEYWDDRMAILPHIKQVVK